MKYKLVKEYPGSPKLGTIISNKENENLNWFFINNACSPIIDSCVEKYSEFWQPVVEKDYEILSFIDIFNNIYFKTNVNIYYVKELKKYRIFENCLKTLKIHSVKRLSDGEIFTIGDIVKCENCKGKITSLEIYDNDIYLTGIDNKMPFGYTLCNALDCFEIPQKIKQPLFTTEDGVDIFENDKVWVVNKKYGYQFSQYKINNIDIFYIPIQNKYFSTKEKAEEFILMNKPCLSISDVNSYCNLSLSQLKNLVKSKTKQSV